MTTRIFFIKKQINENENIEKERLREKHKIPKLVTDASSSTTSSSVTVPVPLDCGKNAPQTKKIRKKLEKKKTMSLRQQGKKY